MASNIDTVQYIVDQAGLGRRISFRKMFGEYALYVDGKVVALICDDQLFLKPTPAGLQLLGDVVEAPPYPSARNYYLLESELDDPERLNAALQVTAAALPEPNPRQSGPRKESGRKVKSRKLRK